MSVVALELLQHLAAHHTASKELEELLLEGPASTALLTAVGRSLHTQPSLFRTVADLCKVFMAASPCTSCLRHTACLLCCFPVWTVLSI